ncbi:ANKK1 [Symbiodinium microadriaticum]|nr:ANKK1 [Symbiodinium microadriaticum]
MALPSPLHARAAGKAWFWTHTAGADLQARTQLGDTPLTLAVAEGRAAAVSFLLEARADANALGACDAENACDLAERRGDEDLVSVLRAAGEVPTSARTWLTSGARDLAKGQGKWYHEVLLRGRFREPQIGWLSARFQEGERDGNGVGDDADGWAFDGERCKQWHAGHTSEAGTVVEEECKGYASFSLRASARQPSLRGDPATSSAAAPDLPWTSTVEQCACRIKAFGIPRYPAVSISGFFSMAISKKVDTGATELLVIASGSAAAAAELPLVTSAEWDKFVCLFHSKVGRFDGRMWHAAVAEAQPSTTLVKSRFKLRQAPGLRASVKPSASEFEFQATKGFGSLAHMQPDCRSFSSELAAGHPSKLMLQSIQCLSWSERVSRFDLPSSDSGGRPRCKLLWGFPSNSKPKPLHGPTPQSMQRTCPAFPIPVNQASSQACRRERRGSEPVSPRVCVAGAIQHEIFLHISGIPY